MNRLRWFLLGATSLGILAFAAGAVFLFGARGFSVREQPSGVERWIATRARSAALPADARIALVDIQMPGLDGFEVLRAIRDLEPPVSCRVLALTALAMDGDRKRMLASGFDGYITKPVWIYHVREQVQQMLDSLSRLAGYES